MMTRAEEMKETFDILNKYRNVFNEIEDITFKKFIKKNKGELKKIKDTYKLKKFQFKIIIRALYICACDVDDLSLVIILEDAIEDEAPNYCNYCDCDITTGYNLLKYRYLCDECYST